MIVNWISGSMLVLINGRAQRQALLIHGWLTICGWVNHLGIIMVCNQPPRSTQPSIPPG